MINLSLWLRWSWRDLRARWLQVVAIALIIALGTGVFAGFGGQETWRVSSLDRSYEQLNMYDLRMKLADGSYVEGDKLEAALNGIQGVSVFETRLITPTLVDASHDDKTILVQGRLVGVDVANGGPHVSSLYVSEGSGRTLTPADSGQNVAVIESQFAHFYHLKPGDPIRISGNVTLNLVGMGQSPEYFLVMPENGTSIMSLMSEDSFAVLFVPLETVQKLIGREGLVNDVGFVLDTGADREAVRHEIERRMASAFPTTGIEISTRDDDPVAKMVYSDARNDQATWNAIATLFLLAATLGAFNLAGRIIEAQRRQIGIGMALGVPRRWIAFRPMLVGFQIAVLGTMLGLIAGLSLSRLFISIVQDYYPLPYWNFSFYAPAYVEGTLLGILLPFAATLIPVWRAVRVPPVDAIRSGYLVAKGGGLSWVANYVPLPGKSFGQMPFKNILRSPWRTLLTVLGITIAIVLMTALVGILDCFKATMEQSEDAYLHEGSSRLLVSLDFFYPVKDNTVTAIQNLDRKNGTPLFTHVETALILDGQLIHGSQTLDAILELHDMEHAIWRPTLVKGALSSDEPGIIISEKAAEDLGVAVGDHITLQHPLREGPFAFRLVQTDMPIIGIHNNPIRALAYMDQNGAAMMGLANVTDLLVVSPSQGVSPDEVKQALLTQSGVSSVQAIAELSKAFDRMLKLIVQYLRVMQVIVLIMAFLIAFNSTSINVDERVREIATMFAFGLPLRTVTRMQMLENLIIGLLGTIVGLVAGWYVLNAFLAARIKEQLADFKFVVTLSPATLGASVLLGVLVVALAPLFSIGRMARMDIPSTLRVME
jgi:putative ABC transport system permease protein